MTDRTVAEIMVTNLRQAADLIAAHPDIKAPYVTTSTMTGRVDLDWYLNGTPDEKAKAAAIVKAIDGTWKRGEADYSGPLATWQQDRGGLRLNVAVQRDAVCERIVTGTETVTIPAVEAQPERVEVVETVEWHCQPLLADEGVTA